MGNILNMSMNDLEKFLASHREPKYRALQIFRGLHKELHTDFEQITTLPKELRNMLKDEFYIGYPKLLQKFVSTDGSEKFLFKFDNDVIIETVLMKNSYGYSLCVSTQAGCKMGCSFCASHIKGLKADLSPGQILAQVYYIQRELDKKISNVVIMGIGEPLDNYDNSLSFIKILTSEEGFDLSQRSITLSTCGLIDKIYMLANEKLQINLAISIHAGSDDVRKKIMPIAAANPIDELIQAAKYYFNTTRRRVSYEYVLIADISDNTDQAQLLASKLGSGPVHVNLIPYNTIEAADYKASKKMNKFAETLRKHNISTTIRRSLGGDINAACGQLKISREAKILPME